MSNYIIFFLLSLLLSFTSNGFAQLIKDKIILDHMDRMFVKTKELSKNRSTQLFGVFNGNLTVDENLALKYLFAYMPLSDLADYNGNFFLANVKMTLKAKSEMSWGKIIPEDIFLHFVLPVRVNNENLDSFRIQMYNELKSRVMNRSMKDAALEVNHWCHEKVTYKASDERTSSPLNTIKHSLGRCGEESTFTVSAMRMVGIPARQVYTPRWAHSDDNHAWVEVWIDGKWYFLGACEPEPDLNMGWFAGPAARAMLVHTRAYGWYNGQEPVIASTDRFAELNLIANYAPVKSFKVKVIDSLGLPVKNAKVEYQLYNYAEFYPIAKTFTDDKGLTGITCGLGDLIIWANNGNAYGYKKITVENTDTVLIKVMFNHPQSIIEEYDLVPPVERATVQVAEKGLKENQLRLKNEDSIRTVYMSTFKDSLWAAGFAVKHKLNIDSTVKFITTSYGNWPEIVAFLENTRPELSGWALKLLSVLSEKDLRDIKAYILNDHLKYSSVEVPILINEQPRFMNYILSPRIANEMLTDWRHYLIQKVGFKIITFNETYTPYYWSIIKWINDSIKIDNTTNAHSRAPLTPKGVYELKVADSRSRDIFFVAVCRSMRLAARLNPETQLPQYWNDKEWVNVEFEKEKQVKTPKGYIHLVKKPEITELSNTFHYSQIAYYVHFTLEYFKDGVYRSLQFDEAKLLNQFPDKIEVDAGKYLLVTGNRMNDGSVLNSMEFFELKADSLINLEVTFREKMISDKPFGKIKLSDFNLYRFQGEKYIFPDSLSSKKGMIMIFIDPDKEPTKHVMNDIIPVKTNFEKWGAGIVFILSKDKTSPSFKQSIYTNLPAQSVFTWDDGDKLLSAIEKIKGRSLKNDFPIIVIADVKGNLTYFSSGYKIGIGEQLVKKLQ